MENFLNRISEIESQFASQGSELRAELRQAESDLAQAQERAEAAQTRYRAALMRGSDDEAAKLRAELAVAKDRVALLEEAVDQRLADVNSGEAVEAALRKHNAVISAIETEGAHAISQALEAAEAARDIYKAALDELVRIQHHVAGVGKKSHFDAARHGRPLGTANVARYDSSEFAIPEPPGSQSARPLL